MTEQHRWLPEHLHPIQPYQPGKPVAEVQRELGLRRIIKLASNENAFGPSPKALEAARRALEGSHFYPDAGAYYLRRAVSRFLDVPPDHLAFGAGSTELIQLLVTALLTPDDHAVVATGTFLMYRLALEVHRIPYTAVPLAEYRYDLEGFLAAVRPSTKMVFIANPNNPTGDYLNRKALDAFLERLPDHVLVVYDEAYHHYVDRPDFPSGLELYRRDPRVIVLHTFSKAYALANLRIGYAVADPEIVRGLNVTRSPFNTSDVAQAAALAALEDQDYMRDTVARTLRERTVLYQALRDAGWRVLPSVTNFFCLLLDHMDPRDFFQTLLHRGIIVRPLGPFGVPQGVRITIGRPEDNEVLLAQLQRLTPSGD